MNITKFSFFFLGNLPQSSDINGSHRKSSIIIDNCRKMAENSLWYTKENNIGPFGAVFWPFLAFFGVEKIAVTVYFILLVLQLNCFMLQSQKSVKCYRGPPIHTLLKLMSSSKNYLRNIQLINCEFWKYNRLNIELRLSLWLEYYNLRSVALWSRMLQGQMITNKFFPVFLPRGIYKHTPPAASCKNKHFECQCIWHEGSTFISQLLLSPWALVVRPQESKLRSPAL